MSNARLIRRWRSRPGRVLELRLRFDDIMELALALLSLSPPELRALAWTFKARKRLLDYLLASGKAAQQYASETLGPQLLTIQLPAREAERLRRFVVRDLPKSATNAAMVHRVDAALESVLAQTGREPIGRGGRSPLERLTREEE